MAGLGGGIAVGLATFIAGAYWPFLRNTSVIFAITCVATLAGLFLGSLLFKDDQAHAESLARFFEKVNTPSPVLEGPPARITFWPLVAGGLAFIGTALIIASVATRPFSEIRLSVAGGAGMLAVAGFFYWLSKRGAE